MNDSLYVFPLLAPPDEDPLDADPPELLDDEQPAASASRMAAAPAVGATKDRFIPAPSYVKTWAGCRCPRTPGAGRVGELCRAPLVPVGRACSAAGNLPETCLLDLASTCHRCQGSSPKLLIRPCVP